MPDERVTPSLQVQRDSRRSANISISFAALTIVILACIPIFASLLEGGDVDERYPDMFRSLVIEQFAAAPADTLAVALAAILAGFMVRSPVAHESGPQLMALVAAAALLVIVVLELLATIVGLRSAGQFVATALVCGVTWVFAVSEIPFRTRSAEEQLAAAESWLDTLQRRGDRHLPRGWRCTRALSPRRRWLLLGEWWAGIIIVTTIASVGLLWSMHSAWLSDTRAATLAVSTIVLPSTLFTMSRMINLRRVEAGPAATLPVTVFSLIGAVTIAGITIVFATSDMQPAAVVYGTSGLLIATVVFAPRGPFANRLRSIEVDNAATAYSKGADRRDALLAEVEQQNRPSPMRSLARRFKMRA